MHEKFCPRKTKDPGAPVRLGIRSSLTLGGLFVVVVGIVLAHEGHVPLPSKGALVDVEKGHVLLTRAAREALDVQSEEVRFEVLPDHLLAYASLVTPWQSHAFATSALPGRIAHLYVRPGQHVQAGMILAEVESQELESLRLELINGELEARQSEESLARKQAAEKALPGQDVQEAETRVRQTRNALEIARGKWLSLGLPAQGLEELLRLGPRAPKTYLPILSPLHGTVIHSDLSPGKIIEPKDHLFEIVDLSRVWVKIEVLEKDLSRVAVGQKVEVRLTAYPKEVFFSRIQVVGWYLDQETHLNAVWGELTNPPDQEPRLLPGMSGEARLELPSPLNSAIVPASAFINDGVDRFVLVETAQTADVSEYVKKSVTVVRENADMVILRAGSLFPGDKVVTRGSHELGSFFVPGVVRLSPEAKKSLGVQVQPAGTHSVDRIAEVPGTVEVPPERRTTIASPLDGTLLSILVERNQRVHPGQVVAEVRSLEMQNFQLELLKEHLTVGLLEKRVEQSREISPLLPQQRWLELRNSLSASRNRRDHLQNRLTILGLPPEQQQALKDRRQISAVLPVRATTSGVVVSFDKSLGQTVRAEEPLFEIHDLQRPLIQGYVSEQTLSAIRLGQSTRVRLTSDPQRVLSGKVVRSGRTFGKTHRTLSVWVELDSVTNFPLRHNQMARLTLIQDVSHPTLAVPSEALVQEGSQAFVFVEKTEGLFERRAVETGRADDRRVEIVAGLSPDEPVAVTGASALQTAYSSVR